MNNQTTEIKLPPLHQSQYEIASSSARFKVVAAGRRFGKSQLGSATCVRVAASGGQAWWVAPNYLTGEAGWDVIRDLCYQLKKAIPEIRIYDSQPYTVRFPSGGMVQIRSAEDPQKLRGKGLNYVVLDECAFMQEAVWEDAIRPALMDKQGAALFISTPFGKNWFYNLYQLALKQQREVGEGKLTKAAWQPFHYTTYDNPFVPNDEIDGLRETMSKLRFDREILAEFVDGEGEVFRGIDTASVAPMGAVFRPDHSYVLGVDLGRTHDYTVISVIDATTKQEVDMDRFNNLSWEFQRGRIRMMSDRWHASVVWVERNSFGDPNIEALQQEGLPVMPFYTTWQSKEPLILGLALGIERGDLEILPNTHPHAAQANRELGDYTVNSLPRGGYKYGAPEGGYDDCVIARALAWHGVSRTGVFRLVVLE